MEWARGHESTVVLASEQDGEPQEGAQARVILEGTCKLANCPGKNQVEKQLKPAGAPLIAVVTVGSPQLGRAEPDGLEPDMGAGAGEQTRS